MLGRSRRIISIYISLFKFLFVWWILSLFIQYALTTWTLIIYFLLTLFISFWLNFWAYLINVLLFITIYRTVYIIVTCCINLLQSALLNWSLLPWTSLILLFQINVWLTLTSWIYITTTLKLSRLTSILWRLSLLHYFHGSIKKGMYLMIFPHIINQGNLRSMTTIDNWNFEVTVLCCHSTLKTILFSILRSRLFNAYFVYFANSIFMYLLLRKSLAKCRSSLIFNCTCSIRIISAFVEWCLTTVVCVILDWWIQNGWLV